MDSLILTAALASTEKVINTALAYDPGTRIALARLAPQVLAIALEAPALCVFIAPSAEGLQLLGHYEGEVTTRLQGTGSALLDLIGSKRINLKDSGVQLFGSTHFLAELQTVLQALDIDWEELLSQLLGDILGHQSAEFIRGKIRWTQDRAQNLQRLLREFLTEEFNALPSKPELAYFNAQVDDVRLGIDRIEARIAQLIQNIQ